MPSEEADNATDSKPPPLGEDRPELSQLIENMGLHFEAYNVPRIGGRILGLLMVANRPLSSEEMADALQVSRSSISTNLKTLLMAELVEKVSLPGDRVDYYAFPSEAWQTALAIRLGSFDELRELAEDSLAELPGDDPAVPRLQEAVTWANLVDEMLQRLHTEWLARGALTG
ncbi:MAG: ArsR family transcriptional regulator [Anaerolineae bacterium]|nr:ArsR family transcriptional regulator [Anaerolineae bacterium]